MEIFKLFGSIFVDSDKAQESISKTDKKASGLAERFKSGAKTVAKWGAALTAAAVGAGGAMVAAAKSTASAADVVDKASIRMGMTAESYQEVAHAAGLCGVEMSTMEKAAKTLKASGSDLSFDEALSQIMAIGDESERSAKAAELFGESAAYKMQPLLMAGAEGMAQMRQEARDMGIVMSNETVAAGAAMNDAFSKVSETVSAIKNNLGAQLMPLMTEAINWFVERLPAVQEVLSGVIQGIQEGIQGLQDFWAIHGEAIMTYVELVWNNIKIAIDTVMNVIKGIIKTVVGIISGDWKTAWEGVKQIFVSVFQGMAKLLPNLLKALVTIIKNIGSAMFDAGKAAFQAVWDGIKSIWTSISNWVSSKVEWLKDKLMFWRSSKKEMDDDSFDDSGGGIDGSHASGLAFVPYDGYRAELHRGERVMTAEQNNHLYEQIVNGIITAFGGMSGGNVGQNINLTVNLDSKKIAEVTFDPLRNVAKQRGVAFG